MSDTQRRDSLISTFEIICPPKSHLDYSRVCNLTPEERFNNLLVDLSFIIPDIIKNLCTDEPSILNNVKGEEFYKNALNYATRIIKSMNNNLNYYSDITFFFNYLDITGIVNKPEYIKTYTFREFLKAFYVFDQGLTILFKLIKDIDELIIEDSVQTSKQLLLKNGQKILLG